MLRLRKGTVSAVKTGGGRVVRLRVGLEDGEERTAIAYPGLTGPVEPGDEVMVNAEAQDLGLGSGGFDVVHANLTPATRGRPRRGARDEARTTPRSSTPSSRSSRASRRCSARSAMPVGVLALHGQLAPAAFALSELRPGARCGYVQSAGGALPGALSDTVAALLERDVLVDHVTAAPCFGGPLRVDHGGGRAARGLRVPRLGLRVRRPGPGHPRLGLGARPRRHVGPCSGPRRAVARMRGRAGAATVGGRPARAPPRPEPSHADRDGHAARAGHRRGSRPPHGFVRERAGGSGRAHPPPCGPCRRCRPARRPMRPAACRPPRWAARSRRTRTSSPRRWPRAPCWRRPCRP